MREPTERMRDFCAVIGYANRVAHEHGMRLDRAAIGRIMDLVAHPMANHASQHKIERVRLRYYRLRREGLCVWCGGERDRRGVHCSACLAKAKARRERRKRKAAVS